MKKYKIIFYENGIQHSTTITARNRREALQKACTMFDTDDLYISEVMEDGQSD